MTPFFIWLEGLEPRVNMVVNSVIVGPPSSHRKIDILIPSLSLCIRMLVVLPPCPCSCSPRSPRRRVLALLRACSYRPAAPPHARASLSRAGRGPQKINYFLTRSLSLATLPVLPVLVPNYRRRRSEPPRSSPAAVRNHRSPRAAREAAQAYAPLAAARKAAYA